MDEEESDLLSTVPDTDDSVATTSVAIEQPEQAAEGDALARLTDPTLSERRARIASTVKARSGLRWVPASELLRRGSQRAGDIVSGGQENLHRTVRDGTGRGIAYVAKTASARLSALGRPRPAAAEDASRAVEREAP